MLVSCRTVVDLRGKTIQVGELLSGSCQVIT